jgi:predicted NAD-dependent protein-ADP-ribosyltransferase YbiA (DUF1768 family)
MVQTYRDSLDRTPDEIEQMGVDTANFLRRTWGRDYDENVMAARQVAQYLGREFTELLATTGLGNDRNVILTLHRIAQSWR